MKIFGRIFKFGKKKATDTIKAVENMVQSSPKKEVDNAHLPYIGNIGIGDKFVCLATNKMYILDRIDESEQFVMEEMAVSSSTVGHTDIYYLLSYNKEIMKKCKYIINESLVDRGYDKQNYYSLTFLLSYNELKTEFRKIDLNHREVDKKERSF